MMIRDSGLLFGLPFICYSYALYKFTIYLLTYLLIITKHCKSQLIKKTTVQYRMQLSLVQLQFLRILLFLGFYRVLQLLQN